MKNFVFKNAISTYFGEGCVQQYLPGLLKKRGSRVMLAYGDGSIRSGRAYAEVTAILAAAEKTVIEFSGIGSVPTYETALEVASAAKLDQVDFILGIGGGPVIDCLRAASLAARYDGDVWEDFWARPGEIIFRTLPSGVVMTADGSGGGLGGNTALVNRKLGARAERNYPQCDPGFIMIDPRHTYDAPVRLLISVAFETLSRIMDLYLGEPDHPDGFDQTTEALMRGMIRDLRAVVNRPDGRMTRNNLMWQITVAENRIIKMGGRTDSECRILERQLGACSDCSCGEVLAVLLPAYYRHICEYCVERFARFAIQVWEIDAERKSRLETAFSGVDALAAFIREIGLPVTLQEIGIGPEQDLREIANACNIVTGSHRLMSHQEIYEIFIQCRESEKFSCTMPEKDVY